MRSIRRESGAALIALVAVLVIAVTAGIISLLNTALGQGAANRNHNAAVLQQAKEALLGYVAKEAMNLANSTPGMLPCPESPGVAGDPGEGITSGDCAPGHTIDKTIGRLPWRTLGLEKLRDSASEPLWYVVSPNWVRDGVNPIINTGTSGQLTVDGIGDVVAIIVAPGAAMTTSPNSAQASAGCSAQTQHRNDHAHNPAVVAPPEYRQYLECQNASFPIDTTFGTTVVDNAVSPVVNDQVVYITAREVLNAIQGPLAERLQRTVAPLLNEFGSGTWTSAGTLLPTPANSFTVPRFLPYARTFAAPETASDKQQYCGGATPRREGLLPVAPMALSGDCASAWGSFTWTGSIGATGCTANLAGTVDCQFAYYTLRVIPLFGVNLFQLLGLASPATLDVGLQATAPAGASAFRRALVASDFTITGTPAGTTATFTQGPSASTGNAILGIQIRVSDASLCSDTPVFGLVCSVLGSALTNANTVTVRFPALSDPTVQGTQLSAAVLAASSTPPFSLTSPAAGAPHYWFFANEWFRYTYYAISPNASAPGTGGDLSVSGFPADFGSATDKRFVLALMGPPVAGQTSRPSTTLSQYLEGENATSNDNTFAYQVFAASGNDRLATCPFAAGASVCD
ncbi:MAG TPA: hypothetical protein VG873_04340 [Burkholderiales bacterium]|nr:hypothetical protein [Burkholderiales bacterium]